jgi:LmbE family N-acetylglucosaminyl deacetylase
MQSAAVSILAKKIRYSEQMAYNWLWQSAPCFWTGRVDLQFHDVPLSSLKPSECWIDRAMVARHLHTLRNRRALAPLVACNDGSGSWYIHDGNHRYYALHEFLAGNDETHVRVARVVPRAGFRFVYRWFGTYGTYLLEQSAPLLREAAFLRRTFVLVAHQDDETGCAGLLQRLIDPIVVFATDGAPADAYFWKRFDTRAHYAAVRRTEAEAAAIKLRTSRVEFLNDYAPAGFQFHDQELYRMLPVAFNAVCGLVSHYRPDTILVPAYEGGHPDHDACSFLGTLLRRRFGLTVWEMPLYHRSQAGELRCQQFLHSNGTELPVILTNTENQVREMMIATYTSQNDVRDFVSSDVELFRPQVEYDYSAPPHPGPVNYECWKWPITVNEVCRAFENCTRIVENAERNCYTPYSALEQEQSKVSAGA